MDGMTESEITELARSLGGVEVTVASAENGAPEVAWGDSFFFYDPEGNTPDNQRFPFATIVTGDYPGFDTASDLDRPGVFRLNVWVARTTFRGLFGDHPGPTDVDATALDRLMPHPIYGRQSWVSILNPSDASRPQVAALLADAHAGAVERHARRNADQVPGDR
jgi:hypothetical protein